jgi:hypothetical protein
LNDDEFGEGDLNAHSSELFAINFAETLTTGALYASWIFAPKLPDCTFATVASNKGDDITRTPDGALS